MPVLSPKDRALCGKQLAHHEGRRRFPYRCTAGKLTIGVGYNIDDRGLGPMSKALGRTVTLNELGKNGLSEKDMDTVLDADISFFESRAMELFPEYDVLDPIRQRVVLDLAFNMGRRALGFKKAVIALKLYIKATNDELKRLYLVECGFHLMDSLWSSQVGDGFGKRYDRAERLVDMLITGAEPTF